MKRLSVLLLLLSFLGTSLAQESARPKGFIVLAGLVVNPAAAVDQQAVSGALVEIIGTDVKTETDKRGQFIFTQTPKGELTIRISKAGYQTVLKTTTVEASSFEPPNLWVNLLPEGSSAAGTGFSGPGTLYVAYSQKRQDQSQGTGQEPLHDLDIKKWLLLNPDGIFHLPNQLDNGPDRRNNPSTLTANHLMIYPPQAPEGSIFHKLNAPPYHLTFDRSGQMLYVADESQRVSIYDENDAHEVIARVSLPVKGLISDLTLSADGNWVAVSVISASSGLMMIDTKTHQAAAFLPLDLPSNEVPSSVTALSAGEYLVTVGSQAKPGRLLIVDAYTGAIRSEIPVGSVPSSTALSADKKLAFVTNSHSGSVTVVDLATKKPMGLLAVGVSPQRAAVTPDGKRLLVSNRGSDTVSVIDTESLRVVGFVRVGKGPTGLAISPDSKTCYVTNWDGGNVSTVDLESLKQTHLSNPMPLSSPLDIVMRP